MELLAHIVLPGLLIMSGIVTWRDKKEYEQFKTLEDSKDRQKVFRKWLLESFALYGLTAVVCLIILGYTSLFFNLPDFLMETSEQLQSIGDKNGESNFLDSMLKGILQSMVPMLLFGISLMTIWSTYQQHKSEKEIKEGQFKDPREIHYLLPRNAKERLWTSLLSLNAGLSEELFFRLLAPILFYIVTDSVVIAISASIIWFGLVHSYQGWVGIISTTMVGLILMLVYLYTQNIWLTIVIHAVLDLNGLFLAPWFKEWLEKRNM